MSPGLDVVEADFEQQVLVRSHSAPVVVDFWAAWCAPCRMLGPVLEREVEALGGRVVLAKVDVDGAPALSQRHGVKGIPAVMAFRDGQVVAEFVGARDAAFVRQWLAALAPSPEAQALARAEDAPALQALLDSPEVGSRAALKLAALELASGQLAEARRLLERVGTRGEAGEQAQALARRVALAEEAAAAGDEAGLRSRVSASPEDVEARYGLGALLLSRGQVEEALPHLLEVVRLKRAFRDDAGRKALLLAFELLGSGHALSREYRRKLQVLL